MKTKIQKWGNSLAIRIPKPFAMEIRLDDNSEVDVSIKNGQLVVDPIKKTYDLDDLLKAVKKDNVPDMIDFGPPVGKEIW